MYTPPGIVLPTPPVISLLSPWATYASSSIGESQAAPASATGPAAFEVQYWPFAVTTRATFTRGWWYNGSAPDATSDCYVGIYNEAGTLLATTAATLLSGASVIQTAAFTASVTLDPGIYYMAIMFEVGADLNGTTAFSASLNRGRAAGAYRQAAGAAPLPNPATFATWTSQVIPFFGVATTSFAI